MNTVIKLCILSLAATTHSAAQFTGVIPDKPSPSPVLATKPSAAKDDEFLPVFVDPITPSDFPSDSPSLSISELESSDIPSDQPSSTPLAFINESLQSDYPSSFDSSVPSDVPSSSPSTSPSYSFSAASVNATSEFLTNLLGDSDGEVPSDTPSVAAFSDFPSDVPSLMPSNVPSLANSDSPSSLPTTVDPLLPDGTMNNYTICGAWNTSTLEEAEVTHSKYVYTLQLGGPQTDILKAIHSVEKLIENELVEKLCGLFPFALAVAATPDDFATATCGDECYILNGAVEIKSSTENANELLEVKCQAQRTIQEMFIYRSFDTVSEVEEATLLYFDQDEELQCSTLDSNPNEGLVPTEQVTAGGASIVSEESSNDGFLSSAAMVGISFLGGTLIAALVVGMHYKRTQRYARRNVNITDEDLSMIIADV